MRSTSLLAAALVTSLAACDTSGGMSLPLDVEDPEAADGKADGQATVTTIEVDQRLYAVGLKKILCGAIADTDPQTEAGAARTGFMSDCRNFDFRVNAISSSTLYALLTNGSPVTMMLGVRVAGYEQGWNARLIRTFGDDFRFGWRAEASPDVGNEDAFILEVAMDPDHPAREEGCFCDFPLAVRDAAQRWVEAKRIEFDGRLDVFIHDDSEGEPHRFIVRDGTIHGYIVSVAYESEEWSEGAFLYYNRTGTLLRVDEWS